MAGWMQATVRFFADRLSREPRYPAYRRVASPTRTVAGVTINSENALTVAAVWACCRYISQTLAQCPWQVYRRTKKGREAAETHFVDYLLHYRPNAEWSPFQFKETMIHWAARHGNAYAEIERDNLGRPAALWPIHPDRVHPMRDAETGKLFYRVRNDQASTTDLDAADMFHVRGFGDGPVGLNVMDYAAESIGWAKATQLFGAAFFGNGMNVSGVVQTKKALTPEGKIKLEADLAAQQKGPRKAKKPLILDAEMSWEQISTNPNDGQFIETNYLLIEEICRWFGTPPHKIMHLLRATFSNIEQQNIEVVVDCITPWSVRLEEEANYKLFGQNRQGFYTKINLRALLRGDFKSQQEGLQITRQMGIINANEWREMLDLNPLPASDGGDKYIVQSQFTTLDKVGEDPTPIAAPTVAEPTNDNTNDDDEPPSAVEEKLANLKALLHA